MLSLSKSLQTIAAAFSPEQDQRKIIAEIHNEIDSAEDRLLKEATLILDTQLNHQSREMAELAKDIGFVNVPVVKEVYANDANVDNAKGMATKIAYYKQEYPFLKFITENELIKICKKYNLVFAPIESYIKDVPMKNLLEIKSAAELKNCDLPKDREWCTLHYNGTLNIGNAAAKKIGLPFSINDMSFYHWSQCDSYLRDKFPEVKDRTYIVAKVRNYTELKQGLFIAAPKNHFNTDGLDKNGLYGFAKTKYTEIKDPIVFRYCNGGIQIISKWGLEASDETLVNEKMN